MKERDREKKIKNNPAQVKSGLILICLDLFRNTT